jgi:hypothetical protein
MLWFKPEFGLSGRARMAGMFKDVTYAVNPERNGGVHLVI